MRSGRVDLQATELGGEDMNITSAGGDITVLEERRRISPVLERDITSVRDKKEDMTSVGEEYH